MVKLTPELINSSKQCINPRGDRELNLRGYHIPQIENLGATLDQFDTIDFSDNDLRKLDGFPYLPRIKSLLLNNNRIVRISDNLHECIPNLMSIILTGNTIQELGDLEPLTHLPNLETICLVMNPVSTKPNYREYVAFKFPNLRLLDFRKIELAHRKEANELFKSKRGKELLKEIAKKTKTAQSGSSLESSSIKTANSLQELERLSVHGGPLTDEMLHGGASNDMTVFHRLKTYFGTSSDQDTDMIRVNKIFKEPCTPPILTIRMKEKFSIQNFQKIIVSSLIKKNSILTARVWRRIIKFLEMNVTDRKDEMKYEIFLVVVKVDVEELYKYQNEFKGGADRLFNNILSNLLLLLTSQSVRFVDIGPAVSSELKQFLKNPVIVKAMINTLSQVFIGSEILAEWIKTMIDSQSMYYCVMLPPLAGIVLTDGVLITSLAQIESFSEWTSIEKARILTLLCHETCHYLARVLADNFNFSSPHTKTQYTSDLPREDAVIEKKSLELGRAVELQLFGCQPYWAESTVEEEKAGEVAADEFMQRAGSFTTLPLFTKDDLIKFKIQSRKFPSVCLGCDFTYVRLPDCILE